MGKHFKYFQPNQKDIKDEYGDCTVRALCKALNISWTDAFDLTVPICRREQIPNIFFAPTKLRHLCMSELGFGYTGISNKKGSKRPTVDEFALAHQTGTYILNVANHEVACVDGIYYDTWDCGNSSLYGYYTLNKQEDI